MNRVMGMRGPLMYSPRSDYLTYPAAQETYDAAGTALATAEPTESQVVYTIQESDLPVSTDKIATMKFTALLYAGGKNNGTGSATVNYRVIKNGTSVATGNSSVAAGSYYTITCYKLYDVKAGDVVEIRLWATAATVDFKYKAMGVAASRYVPSGRLNQLLMNFSYVPSISNYQLTLNQGFNPLRISVGNVYIYTDKTTFNNNHNINIFFADVYRHGTFICFQDKQFFHLQTGDYTQAVVMVTAANAMPYYYSTCLISGVIGYTPTGIYVT